MAGLRTGAGPRGSALRERLTAAAWRLWCRWSWPPDKWQRLRVVAELVGPAREVLDVGGRRRELDRLVPAPVTSANVESPCDLLVPGDRLPLPDAAADVVTSTDVLEHVPPEQRAGHLRELLRVARRRVVICFPAWSERKERAELDLQAGLAELGVRADFLEEHVDLGLPDVAAVVRTLASLAPGARVRVHRELGIGDGDALVLDAMRARHDRDPRALLRVARGWAVRRPPILTQDDDDDVRADTSRVYLVVDLPAARS